MTDRYLYEVLDAVSQMGFLKTGIPSFLRENLNRKFDLRPYQIDAFARFFYCLDNDYPGKERPLHCLFNMATGSGKTLIMAGLILYLYQKGYRNFLFFVNSTNIIAKTRDNFLNPRSSKYLFNQPIRFASNPVTMTPVDNFEGINQNDINICFTTIQKLHSDLTNAKENALTFEDFKDKKIVLLADEAHHMNVSTKAQRELEQSWEDTVEGIFRQNKDNLLLEFTATLDYSHPKVVDKYLNKVLYRFDLRDFRNDGYSKDVYIVQADFEERDRIIQALILSQYKQEVAAKHRINLKPVVLFKAQRTIAQSRENKANFHKTVENLAAGDILRIRERSDLSLLQRAFTFFAENGITPMQLTERLRREFDESRCISVNEEREKENQQILLNTLEDRNNRIRAIFAVQKLNEGWDVLNLFDIVRCYTTRDAKANKPGRTTIAEAQLIGRGARYFPFPADDHIGRDKRKFDKNLTAELRVLEELHYHSVNDSRYIAELRTALINEGMIDEKEVNKTLKLKDSFKDTSFYKHGLIYLNARVRNTNEHIRSFADMGVSSRNYYYPLATGRGSSVAAFNVNGNDTLIAEAGRKDVRVCDIPVHIVRNALARNAFFSFQSLKRYFPYIRSVRKFIEDEAYLGGLAITFQGDKNALYVLTYEVLFAAITGLLERVKTELREKTTEYRGTDRFKPNSIESVFTDKTLRLRSDSERAYGDEQFVAQWDWYVYDANYGTAEEKAFVRMLQRQMDRLKERYEGIYLVRNERHFKIYNYDDGQAFEPDFVLFLREKDGNMLTYQMYVEPKGKHLKEHDSWKGKFLLKLTEKFEDKTLEFKMWSGKQTYRLIGVPFYNNEDENAFEQSLYETIGQ